MIEAGNLFIDTNAERPECFHLVPGLYPNSWAPVTRELTPRDLDRALAASGWTFFYRAGSIRSTAFGVSAALKRLFAIATRDKSNCLEIDAANFHSFLGFPYVTVSAHSRHIQKHAAFSSG